MATYFKGYRVESHRHPNWDYANSARYFLTFITQDRVCNLGKIINGKMIPSEFGKIVEAEWQKSFEIRHELTMLAFVMMPNHIHAIVEICHDGDPKIKLDDSKQTHGQMESEIKLDDSKQTHGQMESEIKLDDSIQIQTHGQMESEIKLDDSIQTHGRASLQMPSNDDFSNNENYHSNDSQKTNPLSKNNQNPTNANTHIIRNPPHRMPKSISSFLAGFKSAVNSSIDNYIDQHNLPIPKYNRHNHFFQPNYHDHIIRNEIEYFFISRYINNNPANWRKDRLSK